jgi:hypothetical protein
VDVGAAAPVCHLRCVALRCLRDGFGRLGGLVVDSCGARPRGQACGVMLYRCLASFPYKVANSLLLYHEMASLLPYFKKNLLFEHAADPTFTLLLVAEKS